MPTIPSYPDPPRTPEPGDFLIGFVDQTCRVKLSDVSDAIAAGIVASIAANMPALISAYFQGLPNEANGDARPSSGPYLSGDGVFKIA